MLVGMNGIRISVPDMERTLIIGDIHGCYTELMDLLQIAGIGENDSIIALGDVVDRGPDSTAVLKYFQNQPRAWSIMGNHERKHLLSYHKHIAPSKSQLLTRQQMLPEFYEEAIRLITKFPLFIELQAAILIHAYLDPGFQVSQQQESILIGSMSADHYLKKKYQKAWYELYTGEKPIIAGHQDYSKTGKPTIYKDKVFLIDTGCCYGHYLTGLLLPEFKILSVKSRKNYWAQAMQPGRKNW